MRKANLYTADAHEAQMKILRQLLMARSLQLAELSKVADLTSDHATYHIKQLIDSGLIERVPKSYGEYRLTRAGKQYANNMDTETFVMEKQPKLVVDIAVERSDGKFLFQERKKNPYMGFWGFPTGKIRWGETMVEAAARELMEETGLTADFRVVGFQHKLDKDENGEILEDKYMCLVHATNVQGELIIELETHTNHWLTPEEYSQLDKQFGDIYEAIEYLRAKHQFVEERDWKYLAKDF